MDGGGSFMESPYFAVISAVGSFFLGIIGALATWRRSSHDKEAQFREDILNANSELRAEVDKLKERVDQLETDLHTAMKISRGWELKFARARILLMEKHQIDLDALLKQDDADSDTPGQR